MVNDLKFHLCPMVGSQPQAPDMYFYSTQPETEGKREKQKEGRE